MYVVDASVWVSRFISGDVHHMPSYRWLEDMVTRRELVIAPALLLAELTGAVARRTGRSELATQALSLLQRLPNSRLVPVNAELAQLGANLAADLHLRGVDAIYVALARRLGIPLITWDREQRERSSGPVAALTPQEALAR